MHKKTDKFGSLPARYCLQEPYTRHIILKAVIEEVEDLPVVTLAAALDAREEAVEPCDTLGEHRPTIRDDLTRALHLLALIGLVATLCLMLSFAEDLTIRFHLKVFLGLASVLTVIVIWFISELKKDADGACGKAPKDAGAKKAQ